MKCILVVEDEPAIATGLKDDLELDGYQVDVAEDGVAAMDAMARKPYDLVLLDVMLPKKDGFSVCRELRASGVRTPIILLTARGEEADKIRGLTLGADDYVTKPFSPRELNARIQAVLRRGPATGSVYKFGNVAADFTRGEVTRAGTRIELTAQEFKLLRAFLEHAGAVLSLDRLIEIVWGKDVFLTDRVVYTHVNNLRGKIEENPSQPRHIVSLRGLGYRFDV
ncbi:MAG TPA: response regulator transcription factor [Bryobacteraceae bacterium]|nr:response regulator transcription factor [Bryobacteraceae bacterium]